MKFGTSIGFILFFILTAACSRNPLGEDLSQTIVNAGFRLSQSCTTTFNEDIPFTCPIVSDTVIPNLVWSLQSGTTCTWAAIDPATGIVTGTPTTLNVGTCNLIVGSKSTKRTALNLVVPITVVNVAPVFTPPIANATSILEESLVSVIRTDAQVQTSKEGFGTYSFANATTTAPRCTDNAATLAIDAANGAVSFAPAPNYFGTCYIKVQFDDGNNKANSKVTSEFSIDVIRVNDPPVIAAISNQTTLENTPISVPLSIVDPDDLILCSIANLTVTSSNTALVNAGSISWSGSAPNCILTINPVFLAFGSTTMTVVATDGVLTDTKSFNLTVTYVNQPPVISAIANQTVLENGTITVPFTITDVDSVLNCSTSMSATSSNLPLVPIANIVFGGVAPNCTATINPALNQFGASNIVFKVTDGTTIVSSPFTLNVTFVNQPPVISAIATQTVLENGTIAIPFTISDVDNVLSCTTSMSATSSNSPPVPVSNIVFSGTAPNCTATITPSMNQFGASNIVFKVTDGTTIVSSPFTLNVTFVNQPPVISAIANQTVLENGTISVPFTISDVDDVLNCTTSMSATSSNLPLVPVANIVFSGTAPNCTATINPALNQYGSSNLVFTVTDSVAHTVTSAFTLAVTFVNQPPVISVIANQTVLENGTIAIPFTISDPDDVLNCTTSMSATSSNLPLVPVANVVFSGTAPNCTATINPALNQFGSSNLVFTVTDSVAHTTSSAFTLTVTFVNQPPVISAITNKTVAENGTISVPFTISDVDDVLNCTTSMSATSSNLSLVPVANIVFSGTAPNCTATINPALNQFGNSNLVFTVTDSVANTTSSAFTLTVTFVDQPPVISAIANQTVLENGTISVPFTITDVDSTLNCSTSMSATSSNIALVPVANVVFSGTAPNCTATINPTLNQFGSTNLSFKVTDGVSVVSSSFTLAVTFVNQPPVISAITNQTVLENGTIAIPFTISDPDDVLNCTTSMSATSSNLSLVPVANIVFSGTAPNCTATINPALNQYGSTNLSFKVTDSVAQNASSAFTLAVTFVNQPPVISAITNKTVAENGTISIPFTISDVDDVLSCLTSMSATSSNLSLVPVANIVFSGTAPNCTATINPALNQFGSANLSFKVTDSAAHTVASSFTLTVTFVNQPPVISVITNQTVLENGTIAIPFTISDPDDVLNCSTSMSATSSNLPLVPVANIVFSGTAPNCTATINPALNQFGSSNLVFTVTDSVAHTTTSAFTLTVTFVNQPPVISAITNKTVAENGTISIPFTISDVDDVLSCLTSMSATSSNLSLVPVANIVFSGTAPNCTATINPALNQFGSANLSFKVTDSAAHTVASSFTLTVTFVDQPPVISAIANQTTNENSPISVPFTITDVDSTLNCSTSMSATSSNVSLVPVANIVFSGTAPNCTASITPALNQFGNSNLVFKVTDGVTTVNSPFTLTVTFVNQPPTISPIANQTVAENGTIAVPFTISDPDSVLLCSSANLSATSSNTPLIPVANVVFSGTVPNCIATISPATNQFGTSNLAITVIDNGSPNLQATAAFVLTVTFVNQPPTISAITNKTVAENGSIAIPFTITDPDDVLNCSTSMSATSSNLTLVPVANIVFSGTAPNCTATINPALNQFGSTNLSLKVTDGGSTVASPFTLTVTFVNQPPTISAITNKTVLENGSIAIPFTITDPDDVLNCSTSMSATSSNLSLVPVANIVFSGTAPNCTATINPALNQSGSTNLVFTVTDSVAHTTTSAFTLAVTFVDQPPVISAITNKTVAENGTIAVPFTITDVDSTLNCSTSMSATSSNLSLVPVANIVFSGTAPNCTATINPALNQFGTTNLSFKVTDGVSTVSSPFVLTVTFVDQPPVISAISNQTVLENGTIAVPFTITDVDSTLNCTTSMSATSSNLPLVPVGNIVFSGTAPNCTATISPALNQFGSTNLVFKVTDGVSTISSPFTLAVTFVNQPPVISAISNQTVLENGTIAVAFTISDPDDALNCSTSMSATSSNLPLVPVANIVFSGTAPNCTATISPALNQFGSTNLVLKVTDSVAQNATSSFALAVTYVNQPPVISAISNQTVLENGTIAVAFTISDPDDALNCSTSMSATSSNLPLIPVANIVFSGTAPNCTATISPALNQFGSSNLVLKVTDSVAHVVNSPFSLAVTFVNQPPVISAITNKTVLENGTIAVAFTISDPDDVLNCSTSMSAASSNLPLVPIANIVFSGTAPNCTATINPALNQSGSSNLSFTVIDSAAHAVTSAFTLNVTFVNQPPVISAITNKTVLENGTIAVAFTITDPDDVLNCSTSMSATSSNLPLVPVANIVFSGTAPNCTATISPALNQFGSSNLVLKVADSVANNATSPFSLAVTFVNQPPTISAITNKTVLENGTIAIAFTITDPDDVLNCSTSMSATSSNLPLVPIANIVFSGTAPNCTATINPALNQSGSSNLSFTVTDSVSHTVASAFTLNVTFVNQPPVISAITNKTVLENGTIAVGFTITDPDDVLNCSTSMSATSSNLPLVPVANIVFSGTAPNCTATISPALNQSGSSNLSFTVTDSVAHATTSAFTLNVTFVDQPPVISAISNQTVLENGSIAVPFTITDVDSVLNCSTSMSATTSNAALVPVANIVFSGTAPNCTATINPALNQYGSTNLSFKVTDGVSTVASPFTLAVTFVNQPPTISAITNKTVLENGTIAVTFTISDPDDALSCTTSMSATSSNLPLVPLANIVFSGTAPNCTATISPALNQYGSSNLSFKVTDSVALNASSAFTLNVTFIDQPPVISAISNQTVLENGSIAVPFTITDVDSVLNCSTSMSATTSNAALVPVANIVFSGTAPNCTATINPALNQYGSTNLSFKVTDGVSTVASPFTLAVTFVNQPPTISAITNKTVLENGTIAVTFTISDPDDALSCTTSMSATSSNVTVVPVANIIFSGTAPNCTATINPALNQFGSTNLVFTVTDSVAHTVTSAFTLNVTFVDQPPVISAISNKTIPENGSIAVPFTITDVDSTLDCTTSMSTTSSNLTLVPVANVVFTGTAPNCTATITPAVNKFGSTNLVFKVTDGVNIVSSPFTLTVTFVNQPPTISAITNQSTNENNSIAVPFTITDPDDVLSCTTSMSATSSNLPLVPVANVVFSGTAPNCIATITPALNQFGTTNLVFKVTDSVAQTATSAFTLTVVFVNQPPTITGIPDQTTDENSPLDVYFNITDPDSVLMCSSAYLSMTSSNPTLVPVGNVVFSGTVPNCIATITPGNNQFGTGNLSIIVRDNATPSLQATAPFTITVNFVNQPPVISPIANKTVLENGTAIINFTITDPDSVLDCVTSMSESSYNPTLVPDANIVFSGTAPNCTATITPAANKSGSCDILLTATDPLGAINNTFFNLAVTFVNQPPVISAISNQSLKTDSSVVINYTLTDPDSTMNCSTSVTATSATTSVIANADLVKGGTAPNCTLTITPSLNAVGSSNITISATDGPNTRTKTFSVTTVAVSSVAVTPTPFSMVNTGSTQQLVATATYSDASTANVTASSIANWTSSAASVATVNNAGSKGLVTAAAGNGNVNLSIAYKGISGVAAATVYQTTGITVSQSVVTGGIGAKQSVTAQTVFAPNGSSDITAAATWTSSAPGIASVAAGVITFNSAGTATITVSYAGFSQTISVTVQNKTLTAITVTPGASTIAVSATKNFVATATYSDASTQIVTSSATWTTANAGIASVSNTVPSIGRATGVATGTVNITAAIGGISGVASLTINAATLSSVAITPYDSLVTSSGKFQFSAVGTFSDSSTSDITEQVTWSSSNGSAATISNSAGTIGLVSTPSFTGYRSTTLTATLGGINGTSPLGVNGATITSILVTPNVTLTVGSTYNLKAYANLSDGGTVDITDNANWTSASTANVTVSNGIGSKGFVTAVALGTSSVSAVYSGVTGARTITVGGTNSTTDVGTGLNGAYYSWTGGSPPATPFAAGNNKGARLDSAIDFNWSASGAPMGLMSTYSVRWTGFYVPTSATTYFCTYSDDGARVWINGVLVINNWTDHTVTWDCSAAQTLTAGTKYSIVVEYYQNAANSEIHLTQSPTSAAAAQNLGNVIPQSQLYPQ